MTSEYHEKGLQCYRNNITKAYIFNGLKYFHLFAGILIPFFTVWGGIAFSQVMVLQAVFTFSVFVFEIPTGALADRFGRKISLSVGSFLSVVGFLLYGITPNFYVFICAEILLAISFAFQSGADQALVYDSLMEMGEAGRSKKIFGQWSTISILSIAIAAPIGSWLASIISMQAVVIATGLPMLAGGFLALSFKEPQHNNKNRRKTYWQTLQTGSLYFKQNRQLRLLAFDYISIAAISFFIVWIYQVVLTKLMVPIQWFGLICMVMTLTEVLVLNRILFLEKLFGGRRLYLVCSAVLIGLGFIVVAWSSNIIITVCALVVIAGFGLTRSTLLQNYMNKHIESTHRATTLSSVSLLYNLTLAVMNMVWGYLLISP
ncbi:MAG: major facilitator superfamily MFS_1 [uncultured bacterium]|nr:MAG: major facilitator superfamily MFS_1 [uncultured bacterium]